MPRELIVYALLGLALPLWVAAGWLDAACHRRQGIEHTSGARESVLHLAMLAELGLAVSAALLLEVNAATFVVLFVLFSAHEGTMWWDLAYANARRPLPWFEQLVHGVQQSLPWAALAGLVLLHPGQALAVFGLGDEAPQWQLRPKREPLPLPYVLSFFTAAALLLALPLVREYARCRRAERT